MESLEKVKSSMSEIGINELRSKILVAGAIVHAVPPIFVENHSIYKELESSEKKFHKWSYLYLVILALGWFYSEYIVNDDSSDTAFYFLVAWVIFSWLNRAYQIDKLYKNLNTSNKAIKEMLFRAR